MTDDNMQSPLTDRRSFLKLGGTVAVTGSLAGCANDGGGDGAQQDDSDGDEGETPDTELDYPTEDVEIIVPFSAGGGFDEYARLMAPYLGEELGTDVVVRNVTGGGGAIGGTQAYNADPDGHTLLIWDALQPAMNQIGRDAEYDIREMSHVGYITQAPNALNVMQTVIDELGIETWDAFVDGVSDLNFSTQGVGSISHLNLIFLAELTGVFSTDEINFVHYDGTGEALSGLERGEANAFMVGGAIAGVAVARALDADMFTIFSEPGEIKEYTDANDIDVRHWSSNLDVPNMREYEDLTVFRRFLTGPPGVDDRILQRQQEAFQEVIRNDQFLDEAREAARPLINPEAGNRPVDEAISNNFDLLETEPYRGILQDAFSD